MSIVRVRPVTKFSEIDTNKFYALYTDMTPQAAAERYEKRFGQKPNEVLTYNGYCYIERSGPSGAWLVTRR